jgi:hypothetical protein
MLPEDSCERHGCTQYELVNRAAAVTGSLKWLAFKHALIGHKEVTADDEQADSDSPSSPTNAPT